MYSHVLDRIFHHLQEVVVVVVVTAQVYLIYFQLAMVCCLCAGMMVRTAGSVLCLSIVLLVLFFKLEGLPHCGLMQGQLVVAHQRNKVLVDNWQ